MKRLLLAVCLAAAPIPLAAQDVIGTAMIDGREVALMSDQTWSYTDMGASDCEALSPHIRFCAHTLGWVPQSAPAEVLAAYTRDGVTLEIASEPYGSDQGLDLKRMLQTAVQHISLLAGIDPSEVNVLDIEDSVTNGFPTRSITYGAAMGGAEQIFVSSYVLTPSMTVHFKSAKSEDTPFADHQIAHHEALAMLEING